jgi:hypothetical protein
MTDQTRQERIAAAREWCRKVGLIEAHYGMVHLTELMADFSLQVEQSAAKEEAWHPIRSEDDLPKVDGEYLVSERTGCDGVITETYDCRNGKFSYHDPEAGGWIPYDHTDFIAWMPFPAPYTEPQTQPHQCNGVDGAERHGTANRCTICGRYSSQWNEGEPQTGGKV